MLAGPDLLVILAIALVVFGPKRLPELARTIGKMMGEFKKTTEEIKEGIGIKELDGIRSNLTGMDLFSELAEKVSESMGKESNGEVTMPARGVGHETAAHSQAGSVPLGDAERDKKEKSEKSEGSKSSMTG